MIGRAIGIGLWYLYDPIDDHRDVAPLGVAWLLMNGRPTEYKHPGHFFRSAEYKDTLNRVLGYATRLQTVGSPSTASPPAGPYRTATSENNPDFKRERRTFIARKEDLGEKVAQERRIPIGRENVLVTREAVVPEKGKRRITYPTIQFF